MKKIQFCDKENSCYAVFFIVLRFQETPPLVWMPSDSTSNCDSIFQSTSFLDLALSRLQINTKKLQRICNCCRIQHIRLSMRNCVAYFGRIRTAARAKEAILDRVSRIKASEQHIYVNSRSFDLKNNNVDSLNNL